MREFAWAGFGLLWGLALTPFSGIAWARIAFTLGTVVLVTLLAQPASAMSPLRWVRFCVVLLVLTATSWFGVGWLFSDEVPELRYSMKPLSRGEAHVVKATTGEAWYRLTIENRSSQDVSELQASVYLPAQLSDAPVLVQSEGADGTTVKARYAENYVERSDGSTVPMPGFTNVAIIDCRRLISHRGYIDVVLSSIAAAPASPPEEGRYGIVRIARRHQHYGEQVDDLENIPIVSITLGSESLDFSKSAPNLNGIVLSPQVSADEMMRAIGPGGTGKLTWQQRLE